MTLRIICSSERCCSTLTKPLFPLFVRECYRINSTKRGLVFCSAVQIFGIRDVPECFVLVR